MMRVIRVFDRAIISHPDMPVIFRQAVVYYHANWQEYFVRFYVDGVCQRKAMYPADSKEDAIERADCWVHRGVK